MSVALLFVTAFWKLIHRPVWLYLKICSLSKFFPLLDGTDEPVDSIMTRIIVLGSVCRLPTK